jgi:argininosuccinate synthase
VLLEIAEVGADAGLARDRKKQTPQVRFELVAYALEPRYRFFIAPWREWDCPAARNAGVRRRTSGRKRAAKRLSMQNLLHTSSAAVAF